MKKDNISSYECIDGDLKCIKHITSNQKHHQSFSSDKWIMSSPCCVINLIVAYVILEGNGQTYKQKL